jgi:hypothetical protein
MPESFDGLLKTIHCPLPVPDCGSHQSFPARPPPARLALAHQMLVVPVVSVEADYLAGVEFARHMVGLAALLDLRKTVVMTEVYDALANSYSETPWRFIASTSA